MATTNDLESGDSAPRAEGVTPPRRGPRPSGRDLLSAHHAPEAPDERGDDDPERRYLAERPPHHGDV